MMQNGEVDGGSRTSIEIGSKLAVEATGALGDDRTEVPTLPSKIAEVDLADEDACIRGLAVCALGTTVALKASALVAVEASKGQVEGAASEGQR